MDSHSCLVGNSENGSGKGKDLEKSKLYISNWPAAGTRAWRGNMSFLIWHLHSENGLNDWRCTDARHQVILCRSCLKLPIRVTTRQHTDMEPFMEFKLKGNEGYPQPPLRSLSSNTKAAVALVLGTVLGCSSPLQQENGLKLFMLYLWTASMRNVAWKHCGTLPWFLVVGLVTS